MNEGTLGGEDLRKFDVEADGLRDYSLDRVAAIEDEQEIHSNREGKGDFQYNYNRTADRAASLDRAAAQGYSYPGTVQKRRAQSNLDQLENQREDLKQPSNRAQGYSYPQRRNALPSNQGNRKTLTTYIHCA
jgi:hypothetical protein